MLHVIRCLHSKIIQGIAGTFMSSFSNMHSVLFCESLSGIRTTLLSIYDQVVKSLPLYW